MPLSYSDPFVSLTHSSIDIHNYYMPNRRSRKISLDRITVLFFEDQSSSKISYTRVWGRGYGPVYWALDIKRAFAKVGVSSAGRSNVVLDLGGEDKVGFTVLDIDSFMERMRESLDYHVVIVNKINMIRSLFLLSLLFISVLSRPPHSMDEIKPIPPMDQPNLQEAAAAMFESSSIFKEKLLMEKRKYLSRLDHSKSIRFKPFFFMF
ncbi:hypothetical protein PMAYCL1PPCAC_29237 [Pristionchus mayeri]|uniref:Uncharacterized protein n=1 Tax=Pristionchus mayeri TaxID=1317129 RepID=A0AAN5DAJ6_9BILA|nr:hypothetical protein PMAYCL1PPCAC_29237 [Pristionchus mayeri]